MASSAGQPIPKRTWQSRSAAKFTSKQQRHSHASAAGASHGHSPTDAIRSSEKKGEFHSANRCGLRARSSDTANGPWLAPAAHIARASWPVVLASQSPRRTWQSRSAAKCTSKQQRHSHASTAGASHGHSPTDAIRSSEKKANFTDQIAANCEPDRVIPQTAVASASGSYCSGASWPVVLASQSPRRTWQSRSAAKFTSKQQRHSHASAAGAGASHGHSPAGAIRSSEKKRISQTKSLRTASPIE
ncbi:hypothetical protein K239x_56040 [Planctomycetes bacterium K23_9]|uniref:Uncharacterized protein n=1 Tax=Stieleria marina TaxID=1930275 RepID=A0A517P2H7_9BACT|nr:hypothetical protein K239x_56040 [Planctomycetes bacterium K23_9]